MLAKIIERNLKILGRELLGKNFNFLRNNLKISPCEDLNYGDYYSNFLFLLSKELKTTPKDIFEKIKTKLQKFPLIKNVDIFNGYLNFFIKNIFFRILKKFF
ncbi:MAG: hypothetical protein NZ866_00975 [Patescibacteria group bacterium]|nr:hypothetical protein [Patescibacteria group bacterium]